MKRDRSVRVSVRVSRPHHILLRLLVHSNLLLLLPLTSFSASLYTETFLDSTAGWQDKRPGLMTVSHASAGGNPGGCLQGVFDAQLGFPNPPYDDSFVATGNLATASFIGDYEEVDAWLLGFDFKAGEIIPGIPQNLQVYLYAGSNYIYRNLGDLVTQTGVWYSFKLPLLDPLASGWVFDNPFAGNILTNVTRVEINVTRNATDAQTYYLDNIFLDRLPDAVQMTATNMVWLHFRNGAHYLLQSSTNLSSPEWTDVGSFTASSSVYNVTVPATNAAIVYRFLME